MKWKSMLLTCVINAFLMLFVTLMLEYTDLTDRFISLEDVVSLSADAALNLATGSEEMFSDKFVSYMSSRATNVGGSVENSRNVYSSLLTYDSASNKFKEVNVYALAKYYKDNNKLPSGDSDYSTMKTTFQGNSFSDETMGIFEWLYGKAGSDYNDSALEWASTNYTKRQEYADLSIPSRSSSASDSNEDFRNYYNQVGQYQHTIGYLKKKKVDGDFSTFKLKRCEYPTLLNMGFPFMDYTINSDGSQNLTKVSSAITFDNFTSTCHVGKSYNSSAQTIYYLTPMSLGVTYVPTDVFKAAFVNNLNVYARLRGISGSSTTMNRDASLKSATGCLETSVYSGGVHQPHNADSSEVIVNDGNVEYDLNSVQVKVDYFFIDFKKLNVSNKDAAATIISRLNGQISQANVDSYSGNTVNRESANQDTLRKTTLTNFLYDTGADSAKKVTDNTYIDGDFSDDYTNVADQRLIAKVTVRVKVHIPYKSSVMQWACQRFNESGSPGHFGIKFWDSDNTKVDKTSDGLWYTYSTFFMQSRE